MPYTTGKRCVVEKIKQHYEKVYAKGQQLNRWPFDCVVAFVFLNYPREKQRKDVRILELGCGAGNNLYFAAKEGFDCCGIDFSREAIDYAKKRFETENLQAEFLVGDFRDAVEIESKFDLVICRGVLQCVPFAEARQLMADLGTIVEPGGKVFIETFSERDSRNASGNYNENDMTENIKLRNDPCAYFFTRRDIFKLLENEWEIESLKHVDITSCLTPDYQSLASWQVVARKAS